MSRTSKADAWMPLYIADYLRDTMHLTRDQHGGYFLLLMACWDRGGRLPSDPGQLAGIAKASPAEWRKLAPVLLPFFASDGAYLVQGRVLSEYEKAARLSETRRNAGLQGGRPRKQTESTEESEPKPNGFANTKQTETPTRVASPSPPSVEGLDADTSLSPVGDEKPEYPPAFEACWIAYPHVRGRSSKSKALGYWRRISAGRRDLLPSAVARYARDGREPKEDCGAPAMDRWLRDQRYLDWLDQASASAPPPLSWAGPADVLAAVERHKGEPWAVSYLTKCRWDPEGRTLTAPSVAAMMLKQEAESSLRAIGVRIVVEDGRAA